MSSLLTGEFRLTPSAASATQPPSWRGLRWLYNRACKVRMGQVRYPQFTIADIIWLTVLIAFVFVMWRPLWPLVTTLVVSAWLLRAFLRSPRS